jgi:hypothetical protein
MVAKLQTTLPKKYHNRKNIRTGEVFVFHIKIMSTTNQYVTVHHPHIFCLFLCKYIYLLLSPPFPLMPPPPPPCLLVSATIFTNISARMVQISLDIFLKNYFVVRKWIYFSEKFIFMSKITYWNKFLVVIWIYLNRPNLPSLSLGGFGLAQKKKSALPNCPNLGPVTRKEQNKMAPLKNSWQNCCRFSVKI